MSSVCVIFLSHPESTLLYSSSILFDSIILYLTLPYSLCAHFTDPYVLIFFFHFISPLSLCPFQHTIQTIFLFFLLKFFYFSCFNFFLLFFLIFFLFFLFLFKGCYWRRRTRNGIKWIIYFSVIFRFFIFIECDCSHTFVEIFILFTFLFVIIQLIRVDIN